MSDLQKQGVMRSRPYLDYAKGQSCVRCGANDGTVVAAHYTGLRQHMYGKGLRIKCSDLASAHLCSCCHAYFDQPDQRKSVEASEDFLHCILLTLMRAQHDGVLGGCC